MEFRVTAQYLESSSEQSAKIFHNKEAAIKAFTESCQKNYFSLLEHYVSGNWRRVNLCIDHNNIGKELEYILNHEEIKNEYC